MDFLVNKRKENNLTQMELAKKCNISRQYICAIENGLRRPSPEVAKRIADYLGFPDKWYLLLERSGEEKC